MICSPGYMHMGNDDDAWKWLETVMSKGFRYPYILQFDESWDKFRISGKWKELMKRFPLKKYEDHVLN